MIVKKRIWICYKRSTNPECCLATKTLVKHQRLRMVHNGLARELRLRTS